MMSSFRWTVALASLLLPALATPAQAAPITPPRYTLKEDSPRLGTNIRKDQMTGSEVALNRTYDQLSEEDKAALNSWWEDIQPGDEPPFPQEGLRAIYDPIRKVQDKLLESGRLSAVATVDDTGHVSSVSVFKSPSNELTQAVARILMLIPFKPAVCGGQPCQMDFPIRLNFTVTRR
ncbi:energy transducer TonB [Ideonella sp. B7]|uniref:energy transducer TonB n=1 Tax=Ideonella benzenivorans TaxID=2831643 RepID=UPI001CECEBF9|nr:energy transducer TonB [Ideonella benzenivorans]MCA6215543.1 energy transducer TonB [Ideonella benzenivorans]